MHVVVQALQAREEMMKQNEVLKEVSSTVDVYYKERIYGFPRVSLISSHGVPKAVKKSKTCHVSII